MKLFIFSTAEIGLYFLLSFELIGLFEFFFFPCIILGSPNYYRYNADFSFELTRFNIFVIFLQIFRKMSCGSSQRRVRQRTDAGLAATRARIESRQVIPERNIVRADVMVAPLDFIAQIIQENHWGYLYHCACPVYPRLV